MMTVALYVFALIGAWTCLSFAALLVWLGLVERRREG